MNKLMIPNGGMPLYGDDFNFLDDAARDTFKGAIYEIAKLYDGDLILGGCEETPGPSTSVYAAGYVMLGYEIRYFPGQTISNLGPGANRFVADDSFDAAGLKSFANGSSEDTYQLRRAKIVRDDDVSLAAGGQRFSDGIYALMNGKLKSSSSIFVYNSWQKETLNNPIVKVHFKQGFLYGGLVVGTISTSSFTKVALLPAGYRPVNRFKLIAPAIGTGVYGNVMLEFFTNGEVYAIATDSNVWDLVSLNVSFMVQ